MYFVKICHVIYRVNESCDCHVHDCLSLFPAALSSMPRGHMELKSSGEMSCLFLGHISVL